MMRERAYYKAPQICSGVPDMRYARLVATTLLGMLLCAFPASYFTGAVVRAARARKSLTRNQAIVLPQLDRKSTRLNSSHRTISYAVFCLKKKKKKIQIQTILNKKI